MQMQKQIRKAVARQSGAQTLVVRPKHFNPVMPAGVMLTHATLMRNGGLMITAGRKGAS